MDFTLLSFEGRLTDDPELRQSEANTSLCKFTVACNKRIGKDGEERTTFIPTTVFGRQAENCAQYLKKGRTVRVVGEFETDTYTDRDGNKRKGFGCIVLQGGGTVEFGSGGQRSEEDGESVMDRANTREQIQAQARESQRDRIFKGKRPTGGSSRR